jgi:hypothetical protein
VSKTITDANGTRTVYYSDLYEAHQLLIPGALGAVVMVQDMKDTGLAYQLRQSVGGASPQDADSPASCKLVLFNRLERPLQVTVSAIRLEGDNILLAPVTWTLPARQPEHLTVEPLRIPSFGTGLSMTLELTVDGQPVRYALPLPRLLEQDAEKFLDAWGAPGQNPDEFFGPNPAAQGA